MYKSFKQMPYLKKILPNSVNLHHAKKTDKPRSYLISSIIRLLVIILKSNYCEMNEKATLKFVFEKPVQNSKNDKKVVDTLWWIHVSGNLH